MLLSTSPIFTSTDLPSNKTTFLNAFQQKSPQPSLPVVICLTQKADAKLIENGKWSSPCFSTTAKPVNETLSKNRKKHDFLRAFGGTVVCQPEGQKKLMVENKSLTLVKAELITNSKNASVRASVGEIEKIASCVSRHLLGLTIILRSNYTLGLVGYGACDQNISTQ